MKSSKQKKNVKDTQSATSPPQSDLRSRILSAALGLLTTGGAEAVTTRAVAEAAGVQPPALYRFFEDKTALLEALTEFAFHACVRTKPPAPDNEDPVESLRRGWDDYVEFGLSNPDLYMLMYTRSHLDSQVLRMAHTGLQGQISRVAQAGRLRLDEKRAAQLLYSATSGLLLTLLGMPGVERDMSLSVIAREAALATITLEAPINEVPTIAATAVTLRAQLANADVLSTMERGLMQEWLDRIASFRST